MRVFTNIQSITRFFRTSLTLFVLLLSIEAWSQNYPVTCTPIIKPSYSLKWSEISTNNDMFKVHLLLKDLTKPSVDVYLKIRLSGVGVDIRTVDGFIPSQTLKLIPGEPVMLTASDLAEYFNISNLVVDGVDISSLYNGGRLPEGLYTWTVEAYEIDRNRQVSNTGMALMNVFKNYPPIINIPQDGAVLPLTTPQNVLFSWTSRSTASLNTAQGKTYKLRIYELSDGDDANMVANSGIAPFREIVTTNPYFAYGSAEPMLKKGHKYAVQVQEEDANGVDDYENEGKSQVVTFTYDKPCVAPEGMVINPIGKGRVELTCEASAEDTETYPITAWYKTPKTLIWNSVPFNGNSAVISGLKDKTDYEFKLSSACGDNTNTMAALGEGDIPSGDPSTETETFKIDDSEFDEEEPEVLDPAILDPYTIGIEINTDGTTRPVETLNGILSKIIKPKCVTDASAYAECSPNHPLVDLPPADAEELTALAVGDVLGIYDYAVLVTATNGSSPFSGEGLVKLPFLDNSYMAVEFSGIKAKKGEAGTQGGCVYEVGDYFRTRPISQADLQNEQVRTIADIIKLTEPTVFHGDLEVAIQKYQEKGSEIASKGTATPQERQDLLTYTKGIEVAIGTWKDKFSEVFGSGETDPKIAEIIGDMTAILTQLNADKQTIEAGTSYPTIPDLKVKIDAIIEKIKALQQENTPKPPRIQNVLATNIGYNDATLTWQGDPRFTKYVISYKTADGGELLETVSGNRLDLKKLQENSQYGFKIEGYVGNDVVDTYVKGNFKTLDNILPPPTNLRYEVLSDNSVKVLWDKDPKHKSFKFTYKGKDGILYTVPNIDARNPSIVLKDLDPTQIYSYEVIGLNNNLMSNTANGVLTSAPCSVSIKVTDSFGGLKKIEASCSGTISWYNGGNDVGILKNEVPIYGNTISWIDGQIVLSSDDGRIIFPSDNISKTYTALCTVTDPNDATKAKSCTVSTEVLARCPEFIISASKTLIENEGEVISLSATGCSGQVIWANGLGEGVNVMFVPNASIQIKAFCQSDSKTCKSNNINIDYQLQACSQLKLYLTEGEYTRGEILPWNDSRYFKVSLKGCSSEANWSITGAGGWRPWNWTKPKITKSDNTGCTVEHARKDTKVTVTCGECPPTSITVEDNSDCDGLKLESTMLTPMVASVRAKEFNDISEQLFSLSDGVKTYNFSNEIRVGLTNQTQVFEATFKNGCKVSLPIPPYKFGIKIHVFNNDYGRNYETFSGVKYDASLLKAQVPSLVYGINGSVTEKPLSDLTISPTVAGCAGNIVWTNNLDASFAYKTDELKFRNIDTPIYSAKITELPFPAVSTIYYATCKGSNDVSYPSNAAELIISSNTCIQISAPTTIPYKGDKIKLIANGCKGTIKWNTGETTPIIEPIITTKTTYQVSCSSPICVESITIDAKEIEISASKNKALIDEIVTLKIVGCQGGTISWNTGQNGSTTNVRPIETTTYTADCMANGNKISTKSITITVDQNIPPLPCIDFKIKADKGTLVRCEDNTITLTAIGCTNGKVTWSSGTPSDDGMTNKLILQNPTTITATCKIAGFDPVSSSKKIVGEDINLTVPIQEVEKNVQSTLTVIGCVNYDCSPGEVFWQTSDNPAQKGQSIRVYLDKPTTYKVYCITQNGAGGQKDITINIKAKEDPFTSGTTPPVCNVELIAWARVRDGLEGASQQYAIPFTPKKCLNLQTYNGHTLNQDGGPLYYISFTPDSQYPAGSITPITGGYLTFGSDSKEGIYKFTGYVLDASGKTLLCKTPELKFEICSNGSGGGSGSCDAFAGNSFEKRIYFDPYDEDRGPAVLGRTLDRRIGKNGEQCEVVKWYEGDSKEELFQLDNTTPVHEVKLDVTAPSTTYRYVCVSCGRTEGTLTYINEAIPQRNGGRIADATTTNETNATLPCSDPMPLESAIANYLSFHICNDINTMKDDGGNFSDAKILNFLQQTITAMKADPKFANVVFPTDLSGAVAAIKQSDCITAGELLSKGTSGTISKTDYTNTAKGYTELNKNILNATKPTLTATTITPASCGLNNGSVKLSATGGTPPYQYSKDGIIFQSTDTFEALAIGKYTFYVKDAKEDKATTLVDVIEKYNLSDEISEFEPIQAIANARANDANTVVVQYDSKHQATTITLNGLEGKMIGNLLRITKANSPSNTHLVGDYYVLFNSQDLNQHTGFYKKEYIDDLNKPCLEQHPTRTFNFKSLAIKCHAACVEAFLPDEFFKDPNDYYINKDGFKATKTSLTALQIDKFSRLIETLNATLGSKIKGTVVAVTKENIDKMLKEAKDKGLTAGEPLLLKDVYIFPFSGDGELGDCEKKHIKDNLTALQGTSFYKALAEGGDDRVIVSTTMYFYYSFFAILQCRVAKEKYYTCSKDATNKETCTLKAGASEAEAFVAGFVHSVIEDLDFVEMAKGLITMAKAATTSIATEYLNYPKELYEVYQKAPSTWSGEDIYKIIPPVKPTKESVEFVSNAISFFYSYYITDANYWTSGELTAMVAPAVITGGAYLAKKLPQITSKLAGRLASKVAGLGENLNIVALFKAGKKIDYDDIGDIEQVIVKQTDEQIENIYEAVDNKLVKICGSCLAQNTTVFGTDFNLENLKPLTSVQTLEKDGSVGQRNVWGKVGRKVSEVAKIWLNGEAIKSTLDHEFISKPGKIVASQIRRGTLLFSLALQSFVPVDSAFIVHESTQVEGLILNDVEAYGVGALGIATAPSNGWCIKGFSLAHHKKFNDWVITQPNFKFKGLVGDDAIKAYIQKLETVLDGKTVEGIVENEMGLLIKTNGSTYGVHKNINGNYTDGSNEIFEYKAAYKDAEYPHSTNGLCMNYKDVPNALYDVGNSGKENIVRIKMKGYRKGEGGDFHEANIQAGFATRGDPNGIVDAPKGPNGELYTWHHLDDFDPVTGECTMQLVKTDFHGVMVGKNRKHTGSVKQYEFYHNKKYVKPSIDTECDN